MIAFLAMLSATIVQGAFALVEQEDPITQKRAIRYELASGRNKLLVGCDAAGSGKLFVRLTPRFWAGPDLDEAALGAIVDYRFGADKKRQGHWQYADKGLEVSDLLMPERAKARFIDRLAKDREVHIRYVLNGERETISFRYDLSADALGRVVRDCDPRIVQRVLRSIGSPLVVTADS